MMVQYGITAVIMSIAAYMDLRTGHIKKWLPALYVLAVLAGHGILFAVDGQGMTPEDREILFGERVSGIVTGMIPGVIGLFLSLTTKQAFGYGDSLLILVCGISLGLSDCVQVVMTAFTAAGVWAVILLVREKGRERSFPFIPFLLAGVLVGMWQKW